MDSKKQPHFRLLDLPPELVVRVVEFAVIISSKDKPLDIKVTNTEQMKQPAVTCTCRLLRHEGLPKFYARNVFRGDSTEVGTNCLRYWLNGIGQMHRESVLELWVQWSTLCDSFQPPKDLDDYRYEFFQNELIFHRDLEVVGTDLFSEAAVRTANGKILLKTMGSLCYHISLKAQRNLSVDWKLFSCAENLFNTDDYGWFCVVD